MEEIDIKSLVKQKCPKAFLRRTLGNSPEWYEYQVRVKTGWFSSKPVGEKCYFQDQAWESALKTLTNG